MSISSRNITVVLLILLLVCMLVFRSYTAEATNEKEIESDKMNNKYTGHPPKTKNFDIKDLRCKDGTPVPEIFYGNAEKLLNNLQKIRDHIQLPIVINSGYRTASHNAKVAGAKNSQHLTSSAADIRAVGMTASKLHSTIIELINKGLIHNGGVGKYQNFVHYDIAISRRWNG